MRLSDSLFKKLVVLNTICVMLISLLGVVWVSINKDALLKRIKSATELELHQSKIIGPSVSDTTFSSYDIKINPAYLRDIQLLIEKMAVKGVMANEDKKWYPVRFIDKGQEYKGKIRLRGDLPNHWINSKKSWRLKFDREKLFNGYRALNFVIPSDKAYEIEKIAYDLAKEEGLLAPDSGFLRLRMNGVDTGLYFWYENNSSEMLEKCQYPEGEIFRDKNTWTQTRPTGYSFFNNWEENTGVWLYPSNYAATITKDPTIGFYYERWDYLLSLLRDGSTQQFEKEIPHLIDMDKYLRWNALTWLFGSVHSHFGDNLRWYYDNTRGLFEPIMYDVFRYPIDNLQKGTFEAKEYDPLAKKILQNPEFRDQRNKYLWHYVNTLQPEIIQRSEQVFNTIRPFLFTGIDAEKPKKVNKFHRETINILNQNRDNIKGNLEFSRVFITPEITLNGKMPVLSIKLIPDALAKIKIKQLRLAFKRPVAEDTRDIKVYKEKTPDAGLSTVPVSLSAKGNEIIFTFKNLTIQTPVDKNLVPYPEEVIFFFEMPQSMSSEWKTPGFFTELKLTFENDITHEIIKDNNLYQTPVEYKFQKKMMTNLFLPVDTFIEKSGLPFKIREKELILERGTYSVNQDLIVPVDYRLHIHSGVILKMGTGVSIITYQPLKIAGTRESRVVIEAKDSQKAWGSLSVINAKEMSEIDFLNISGGSEDRISGLYVSGQFCFYSSDVKLRHCTISDGKADDGLNIKNATMTIMNCEFIDNSADAFDGDWVKGKISHSQFKNNGGDGIDLSGSVVITENNLLSGMGDKALSIGEKSTFYGINNVIRNSNIGVASKDLSNTNLYASVFYANTTAIALYRKKQTFGGGQGFVASTLFWKNTADFELDRESTLKLVGVGLENWSPQEGIETEDIRVGPISESYRTIGEADFSYINSKESPFKKGPVIHLQPVEGVSLPEFSKHPIGLTCSLEIE